MQKITEISEKTHFCATLVASGYQLEEAEKLTACLGNDGPLTEASLIAHNTLEMAETLSLHWLVSELRKRAASPTSSPETAVAALKVLAELSLKFSPFPRLG